PYTTLFRSLAGLQHGQTRRAVGHALEDDRLDRGLLAPVLLVGLEHELDAGALADEPIGPEPHGLPPEALLADLLDVLLRHDPGRTGGRGGVEQQKVRPRLVQPEPYPKRIEEASRRPPVV